MKFALLEVMAPSAISSVFTLPSCILSVVTASSASLGLVTAPSANFDMVIEPSGTLLFPPAALGDIFGLSALIGVAIPETKH